MEFQQKDEIIQGIHDAAVKKDEDKCVKLCGKVIELRIDTYEAILKGISADMDKKGGFVCPVRVFRAGTSVVFRCPVRRFKNSQAPSEVGPSESKGKTRDRCCPGGHPRH